MPQSATTPPFGSAGSGRGYAKSRYKGFFQKLVARREQYLAKRLLCHHNVEPGGHAMDIPCGYGRFYPLLKRLGFQVSAMDQSQAMVQICQEQDGFRAEDHAVQADVLRPLPSGPDRATVALCVRLFQHLHHSPLRIQALRTLAGNRRQIVMTYYDRGCLHYWSKRLLMRLKGKPVRIKMIARSQFESEVAEAGLRVKRRIKLLPGIHAQTWVLLEPAG